ncbi:MAG: glutathione peroxidase [bacterium]
MRLGRVQLFVVLTVIALVSVMQATAKSTGKARMSDSKTAPAAQGVHSFTVTTIDGKSRSLADYRGRALLIVNTASRCGFTKQYATLETLYDTYKARGFEVLAFPANDFMGQEPGTNAEIQKFCTTKYSTSFPLFAKVKVKGDDMVPLYRYLTKNSGYPGDIPWNFTKFLVDANGQVVARFDPRTAPDSPELVAALEKVLPPTR